jgi:hypothetical protein
MRGRWLATCALASVVLGCAPAPSPTPPPPSPSVPANVVPWPDIVWTTADGIASSDPGEGEQAVAVTVGPQGFVAVGYRDEMGGRGGLAWFSPDGTTWARVGGDATFDGVEMLDVAPGPVGFVALGMAASGVGDRPHAVFFHSPNGRTWKRLPDVGGAEETYPSFLAGGARGVVAVGIDDTGTTVIWRSTDGTSFQRDTLTDPVVDELTDPHASPEGYVALGSENEPPVLLRSKDARTWTDSPIDPAHEAVATRLVPIEGGYVVQGLWDPRCDEAAVECEQRSIGWWSPDGRAWTRLPDRETPIGNGASIVVPAGDHGVIAIDGASAWASPNGWGWQPLPEPSDGSMVVFDAVVAGDTIVAVGAVSAEDGSGRSAILVAAPPALIPDVGSAGPGSGSGQMSAPPESRAPEAGAG